MNSDIVTFDPETHTYAIGGKPVPSVTQILKSVGMYSRMAEFADDSAMTLGTWVHQATQYYDEGDLDVDSLSVDIKGYMEGWSAFRSEAAWECSDIEVKVFRRDWWYAGTIDRVGVLNRVPAILDIKTGAKVASTGVQLSGYAFALDPEIPYLRCAVHLKPTGQYTLETYSAGDDLGVFLSALRLNAWKERNHVG